MLYSVGEDGQVAELDGATGRVLAKFKGGKKGLSGLALSPGEINRNTDTWHVACV